MEWWMGVSYGYEMFVRVMKWWVCVMMSIIYFLWKDGKISVSAKDGKMSTCWCYEVVRVS